MILKKSKITYFIWALFLVLSLLVLLVSSTGVAQRLGQPENIVFIGIAFFVMVFAAVGILLLRNVLRKFSKGPLDTPTDSAVFMESVFVFFAAVLSFMLRFIHLAGCKGQISGTTRYYDAALDGTEIGMSVSEKAYVTLLHGCMELFGERPVVAMYIQILMQMLVIVATYFIVKFLIGRLAGALAMAICAFLPYSTEEITRLSPDLMVTLFLTVSIFFTVYAMHRIYQPVAKKTGPIPLVLLSGVFSGLAVGMDVANAGIVIAAIGLFVLAKKNTTKTGQGISMLSVVGSYIAAVAVGFMGMLGLLSGVWHMDFMSVLNWYAQPFTQGVNFQLLIPVPAFGTYASIIPLAASLLWIFRMGKIQRDHGSFLYLLLLFPVIMVMLGWSNQSYVFLVTYLYSLYAAMGLQSLGENAYIPVITKEEPVPDVKKKEEKGKKAGNKKPVVASVNIVPKDTVDKNADLSLDFLKEKEQNKTADDKKDVNADDKDAVLKPENKLTKAQESSTKNTHLNQEDVQTVANDKHVGSHQPVEIQTHAVSVLKEDDTLINKQNNNEGGEESLVEIMKPQKVEDAKTKITQGIVPVGETENADGRILNEHAGSVHVLPASAPKGHGVIIKNMSNSVVLKNDTPAVPEAAKEPEVVQEPLPVQKTSRPKIITSQKQDDVTKDMINTEELLAENAIPSVTIPETETEPQKDVQTVPNTTVASSPAVPPVAEKPVVPVVKYGRRMDYKTAKVSSGKNSSPILDKTEAVAPKTITPKQDVTQPIKEPYLEKTLAVESVAAKPPVANNRSSLPAKSTAPIYNPLPTPKKHIPKEMDFDVIPAGTEMHFDLVDLKGRDYFDIN